MNRRTLVTSIVAALSLSVAGFAAARGHEPDHGRPSVTPPPVSHGHGPGHGRGLGHGHAGEHGLHLGLD